MSWGRLGSHVLFWWPSPSSCPGSPVRSRQAVSLLLVSAAAVLFLILGLNTEGQRDAPPPVPSSSAELRDGPGSAAASLPYYVMTGVCLLLGTVGLALPEAEADRLAGRRVTAAVAVSVMVTLVRFGLEQAAAPASWTRVVGIADLAPVVGAYFALDLMAEKSRVRAFFLALLVYALAVRAWVALFYLAATSLRLGSHLDLSSVESVTVPFVGECRFEPGSLEQLLNLAILPQLTFWPLFTVLAGRWGGLGSWCPGPRPVSSAGVRRWRGDNNGEGRDPRMPGHFRQVVTPRPTTAMAAILEGVQSTALAITSIVQLSHSSPLVQPPAATQPAAPNHIAANAFLIFRSFTSPRAIARHASSHLSSVAAAEIGNAERALGPARAGPPPLTDTTGRSALRTSRNRSATVWSVLSRRGRGTSSVPRGDGPPFRASLALFAALGAALNNSP